MPDGKEIIVEASLCSSLQTSNRTRSSPRMSTSSLFCCMQRSAARFNLSVNGLVETGPAVNGCNHDVRVQAEEGLACLCVSHSVSSPGFHAAQSELS